MLAAALWRLSLSSNFFARRATLLMERMNDPLDRLYERVLVLRCQTGDESAFAEMVQRYHARLRTFLRSMLGDAHLADDALQEVWLDVFRGVGKLRDTGAFSGWVYRIARDRAYRLLRRKPLATEPIDAVELADAGDEELDADERELVKTSLERLPHEQREVVLLRFVEQMSYEQIAAAVGCELGTVRSRLHYAKRALRQMIERNGHEQQR
jgi:RNA polymerase sigma-70 factor (ECF subfamily)